MFDESSTISRMSGCLAIMAAAAISACGGGNGNGSGLTGAAPLAKVNVVADSPAFAQMVATTTAIADVVEAGESAFGSRRMPTPAESDQLDLALANAFKSSQLGSSSDVGAASPAPAPAPAVADVGGSTTVAAANPPASNAPASSSWRKIASEGQSFATPTGTTVRYGAGDAWVTRNVNGSASCTNAYFCNDPMVGIVKQCEITSGTATVTSALPTVDASKIPAPAAGYAGPRVMPANVADPTQLPTPSSIGAFREPCTFSHMSFDDPIVYPGQPGRSHLHAFFGNTGTSASTTASSLASSGNSTCAGGTLNRTAYWVPAMIDTRTGTPVKPTGSIFYYKTGINSIDPSTIQAPPQGLRMISGDPSNSGPSGPFRYGCVGATTWYWAGQALPACAVGQDMLMEIAFPQCWDGVNLDSPDHRSHMTWPVGNTCPRTHPVPLPEIRFEIHYTITAADDPTKWRLSSDLYDTSLPGGYSAHADWFDGWDPSTMSTMITNCEQTQVDCHAYLLGDGRTLY